MTFPTFDLLFPIVLAIHNVDEYRRCDDFIRAFHPSVAPKLTTRRVVRDGAILLTITVAILSVLTYTYNSAALVTISKVAIFALMLNGIGHCILSLKRRTLVPGTLSAVILILPYSAFAIVIMHTRLGDSFWSLLPYMAFGALTAPVAILIFLWVSYGLSRLTQREQMG